MRILFTGASSFTGYWFVKELSAAGHSVHAVFTSPGADSYGGVRGERVRGLRGRCTPVFGCRFGDGVFTRLIAVGGAWDLLCHHAADVTNYKSPDFDLHAAVAHNTNNLPAVLKALKGTGCARVLLTGSVFENDEGAGEGDRPAFSPYGLSKGLTFQVFRYYCAREGLALGKFVIPNPFGPWEEPRFTTSLVRAWARGERPVVRTPSYVRDNIHAGLLAGAYRRFAERVAGTDGGLIRLNPSGYAESQGEFARRFAREMGKRLPFPCPLELTEQIAFPEPRVRVNTDPAAPLVPGWDETAAWDGLAEFYRERCLNG